MMMMTMKKMKMKKELKINNKRIENTEYDLQRTEWRIQTKDEGMQNTEYRLKLKELRIVNAT